MSFYIHTFNNRLIIEDLSSILPYVYLSVEFVAVHPNILFDLGKTYHSLGIAMAKTNIINKKI